MAITHTTGSGNVAGSSTSSGTTLAVVPGATIPVGRQLIFAIGLDNTSTTDGSTSEITGIADNSGGSNVYTFLAAGRNGNAGAAAGAQVELWLLNCTTQLTTSHTITITFANTITAKAVRSRNLTVGAGMKLQLAGTPTRVADDNVTDPSNLTVGSLSSKEYCWFRAVAVESQPSTYSKSAAFDFDITPVSANTGSNNGSMEVAGEIVIATGTTKTSAYIRDDSGGRDMASVMVALEEVSTGGTLTGAGAAAGVATVSGIGRSTNNGVGSSTGLATVAAVGRSTNKGVGSAAGTSTAAATGQAVTPGVGLSAGVATAAAIGRSTNKGVGASAGLSTAAAVGRATAKAVGSSAGLSTATAVSKATKKSVGASDGVATVAGIGRSTAKAAGLSAGVGAATGIGRSTAKAAGASAGVATAAAVGRSTNKAVGLSAGVATVTAVGEDAGSGTTVETGAGLSQGTSAVTGVGRATAKSIGLSTGLSTALGVGRATAKGVGLSQGTSVAAAIARLIAQAVGSSTGTCAVVGVGRDAAAPVVTPTGNSIAGINSIMDILTIT